MSNQKFKAQSDGDGDEWYDYMEWYPQDAAEKYAEEADDNSGGEFSDDTVVQVKDEAGVITEWVISVGYRKTFAAFAKTPKPVAGTTIVNDGRPV